MPLPYGRVTGYWTASRLLEAQAWRADHLATAETPGARMVPAPSRVVGVLGGYQQGGNTAGVSCSAYLGNAIRQLYQQAAA